MNKGLLEELTNLAIDFMGWQQSFSVSKKFPCPYLLVKPHWHQLATAVFKHAVAGTIEMTTERA